MVQEIISALAYRYQTKMKGFVANPVPWVGYREEFKSVGWSYTDQSYDIKKVGQIGIVGDVSQVKLAKQLIAKKIRVNYSQGAYGLGMVPFEVIRDMLRESPIEGTIGGAPQIVIVHQFMQATPVGVYWPDRESAKIFMQGRRTLGYENIDRYILDPDTLELESPYLPEKPMPKSE